MSERSTRAWITANLRRIFLKSKERTYALKRDGYTCQKCGAKQSKAKGREVRVNVHHKKGIKIWDDVIEKLQEELFCETDDLITLCKECHDEEG